MINMIFVLSWRDSVKGGRVVGCERWREKRREWSENGREGGVKGEKG